MKEKTEPDYQIISWEEFESQFSPTFSMPFGEFIDELDEIYLYTADSDGNIHIHEDLDMSEGMNAVYDGNLIVDGSINMSCDEGVGIFLFVNGNVTADSILLKGMPSMHITGDAEIKNGIMGMYGDNGGSLTVSGNIKTMVVVNATYFNMEFSGEVEAVVIDTSYEQLEADFTTETIEEGVIEELIDDGRLDASKTFEYIASGKNILKSGLSSKG